MGVAAEEIEGCVLHSEVVDRALCPAIEELHPKKGRVENERGRPCAESIVDDDR